MIPDSANSLGGVLLPVGVRWIDKEQWAPIGQTTRYSLAGDVKVRDNTRTGQPITLQVSRPYSWLYSAKLTALQALAATPATQYTLTWNAVNYAVIFRHVDTALDFVHVESPSLAIDEGIFEGRINLFAI